MAYDKVAAKQDLRDRLVAEFAWPVFEDAELLKFTKVVADWLEFQISTVELNNAILSDTAVTGTVDGGGGQTVTATVTGAEVEGGII